MEKIDYKKEYKDIYFPKEKPVEIDIPKINYIMVKGKGNPNSKNGEYKKSMELLYALTFTIKMSKMGNTKLPGYFEYVVPPLEGIWWMNESTTIDYSNKDKFEFVSMIRQPEFVTEEIFNWAKQQVLIKKPKADVSSACFKSLEEGLCVQIMHIGPYDDEPATLNNIEKYINENNLKNDIGGLDKSGNIRRHHEIYLSDPRKIEKEKLKTVIRIPVKKV